MDLLIDRSIDRFIYFFIYLYIYSITCYLFIDIPFSTQSIKIFIKKSLLYDSIKIWTACEGNLGKIVTDVDKLVESGNIHCRTDC